MNKKPIKIKDLDKFPRVPRRDVQEVIKGLHGDGFDYFCALPVKRGVVIWYGRTERESPTRH